MMPYFERPYAPAAFNDIVDEPPRVSEENTSRTVHDLGVDKDSSTKAHERKSMKTKLQGLLPLILTFIVEVCAWVARVAKSIWNSITKESRSSEGPAQGRRKPRNSSTDKVVSVADVHPVSPDTSVPGLTRCSTQSSSSEEQAHVTRSLAEDEETMQRYVIGQ